MGRYLTLWIGFPWDCSLDVVVLYIHSVGRTCVVTASHGSPCCPKYFNWWSGVATYIPWISNWVSCMGPPYVGVGSKQDGYPLCPGSAACCDVGSRAALPFIAVSTMRKRSCGCCGPVFVASCQAGSPRWTHHTNRSICVRACQRFYVTDHSSWFMLLPCWWNIQ